MSENIIQECETRLNSLQRGIETATGESYNDLTEAVKGSIDRYENKPWYDFTIELTSDVAHGGELKEVLTPYLLDKMRTEKDMALCSLLNVNKTPSNTSAPITTGLFAKNSETTLYGKVSRYRTSGNNILNIVDPNSGYGCVGLAGDKYYVKVVNVLE